MAEIALFNKGKPPLTDIPGRLRFLADEIERGDYGEATTLFVVIPVDNGYPITFGYGNVDGENHPIIQLELAKASILSNLTGDV